MWQPPDLLFFILFFLWLLATVPLQYTVFPFSTVFIAAPIVPTRPTKWKYKQG